MGAVQSPLPLSVDVRLRVCMPVLQPVVDANPLGDHCVYPQGAHLDVSVTPTGTVEVVGSVQSLAPLFVAVRVIVCIPVLQPVVDAKPLGDQIL